jgi:hypothetical protein
LTLPWFQPRDSCELGFPFLAGYPRLSAGSSSFVMLVPG